MNTAPDISENGRRIARNTAAMYLRMFIMIIVGLFTFRVILKALGVTDYGVYSAVGGIVTMFTIVLNTVVTAISRFITVGLGKGGGERLHAIFSSSLVVQFIFCAITLVLTETAGIWYMQNKMDLPPDRMGAAMVVLQTSLGILLLNLLSIPFTALLTAHEHLGAYAAISIADAMLKLAVAFGVWFSPQDKLATYAVLLLVQTFLVKGAFALYALRHFPESRGRIQPRKGLVKDIFSFTGWNFLGSGAYMLNTQGINQLMNHFFGVTANAARGVADKVEQVVRQFATNIALALNPQLIKSYSSGDRQYAFDLVCKGSKYYFWVMLALALPFITDAETILRLWLGEVPPDAALFTRLTIICFLVDYTPATVNVLQQADGRIRKYYILTSLAAIMAFAGAWVLYSLGAPAWSGYAAFIVAYVVKAIVMLAITRATTGFTVSQYIKGAVLPMLAGGVPAALLCWALSAAIPVTWWRFVAVAATGAIAIAAGAWLMGGLTEGEKAFVRSTFRKIFKHNDKI